MDRVRYRGLCAFFGLPQEQWEASPGSSTGAGQDLYGEQAGLQRAECVWRRATGGRRHLERERGKGHVCKVPRGQNQPQ